MKHTNKLTYFEVVPLVTVARRLASTSPQEPVENVRPGGDGGSGPALRLLHRPRPRLLVGDPVMVNGKASGNYRYRRGLVTDITRDGAWCGVEFEDGLEPTTGWDVKAVWLDL